MKTWVVGTSAAVAALWCGSAVAEPPIWEATFGDPLGSLFGEDDEAEEVSTGFAFPYAGGSYSTFFVGTNGAIALGDLGEADDYPSGDEFIDTDAPMLAPFWSDMDLGSMGTIYFNDFGDRAVFTWLEIGSFTDETSPFTFQLQILGNGTIIFGYNGITPISPDTIDENVHVGLTEGSLDEFPTEVDYSADMPFETGDSVLELFEYDPAETFDLDMTNIVFNPREGGGYLVSMSVLPTPGALALLTLAGFARRRRRAG